MVIRGPRGPEADAWQVSSGRLMALGTAFSFGGITTFARLAYDAGAEPFTVITARLGAASVVIALLLLLWRKGFALPRPAWPSAIVIGVTLLLLTLGYLSSVKYIPVGLAALLFFTFPLMVAGATPLMERRVLGRAQLLAFILAFGGLALAIGPRLGNLDPRGVGLALMAAVACAGLLFATRALVVKADPLVGSFHGNFLAFGLMLLVVLFAGLPPLPAAAIGWLGLLLACVLYASGLVLQFLAVHRIGAAQTAMFLNLEPIVSILAALLLLGERLSLLQWGGVALVLGSVYLASRRRS